MLKLSPNEREQLERERFTISRQSRLAALRAQEKELAAAKRERYRHEAAKERSEYSSYVAKKMEAERQRNLATVEQQLDMALEFVGESYIEAQEKAQNEVDMIPTWRRRFLEEDERYNKAIEESRNENALEQADTKAQKLTQIRDAETMRARQLAKHHRETHPHSFEVLENIPQQKRNFLCRSTYKDGRTKYDDTYHHRDYLSVWREDSKNHPNADNATVAAIQFADKLSAQRELDQKLMENRLQERQTRFNSAMHDVKMNHEAVRLDTALAQVSTQDGRRKQVMSDWTNARYRTGVMGTNNPINAVAGEGTRQKKLSVFFDHHFTALAETRRR